MSEAGRMPMVFFGHGSPMNALEDNALTQRWNALGRALPRPKAILCISAHWLTRGIGVTAMAQPRTIHDFGAFPQALFDVRYPAPGSPQLAQRVQALLAPDQVVLDEQSWGLDHGTWSVLVHAYPQGDIPVVQLSMDMRLPPAGHYALGQKLRALREEGVLIIGTGNIVHNLRLMDWDPASAPYDWAQRFHDRICQAVVSEQPQNAVDFAQYGDDAARSVPSPDHYWPLLYVLGARAPGEAVQFENNFVQHKSLSMVSMVFGR